MDYALLGDKIVPKKEISVSLEDRGYQFGDGVYEVIRVYGGVIFHLEAHLGRLDDSAKAIYIDLPCSLRKLGELLGELVKRNGIVDGKLYLQLTRGVHPRVHFIPEGIKPILTGYAEHVARPLTSLREGISALTVEDNRWLRVNIKSLNLLPNVLAKHRAKSQGADEAIFVRDGLVTEGSASNVYGIRDGVVYTHPANHLILNGITRQAIVRLSEELGIPWREVPISAEELARMDEVFVSNTILEICPVVSVDGRTIGDGKIGSVTASLQAAFERKIESAAGGGTHA